jgi:tetratricopeptide (TPR) repeat protein
MESKRRALVIGISDYENLGSLTFCRNDGHGMVDVLSSLNYEMLENNVMLGNVRWENMRDAIYDFFSNENVKPTDTLLFYYSGHGVPDDDQDVFLATSDIDPNIPSRRGFNFNELTKVIGDCISTSIVAILDCCYSGSARFGHSTIDRQSERVVIQGEGKCILAASQAQGEAYVLEEHNHSVFTYYLLQALGGKVMDAIDKNGYVTVDSLSKYVYNALMSLPPSKRPKQKPVRKLVASGDIVLAHYPIAKKIAYNELDSVEDLKSIVNNCRQYFDNGEFELELDYLQEAINRYPNDSDLWNYKGVALAKLSRYDEAISCFDIAIMLNPKSANLLMNRGDSLSKQGRIEESIKSFDNALTLDVNNSRAWSLKARLLLNQKKYEEALECLDKATQKTNEKVLWNDKGFTLAGLGRYQEAIQSYENVLKIDPNYDVTLNNKGLSLYRLGKYQEAINCFDRILVLNPNSTHVLINKYNALNKLGKTAEANRCYKRLQKIDAGYNKKELYDANGRLIS